MCFEFSIICLHSSGIFVAIEHERMGILTLAFFTFFLAKKKNKTSSTRST